MLEPIFDWSGGCSVSARVSSGFHQISGAAQSVVGIRHFLRAVPEKATPESVQMI